MTSTVEACRFVILRYENAAKLLSHSAKEIVRKVNFLGFLFVVSCVVN